MAPRGRKPRTTKLDEKSLTRGELRKLNALRKSLGDDIGIRAFTEWYKQKGIAAVVSDRTAARISEALQPLVKDKKARMPRGGYRVRRGRGRIIVEPIGE